MQGTDVCGMNRRKTVIALLQGSVRSMQLTVLTHVTAMCVVQYQHLHRVSRNRVWTIHRCHRIQIGFFLNGRADLDEGAGTISSSVCSPCSRATVLADDNHR